MMRPRRTLFTHDNGRVGRRWGAFGKSNGNAPMILTTLDEVPNGHATNVFDMISPRTARTNAFFRKLSVMCFVTFIIILSVHKIQVRTSRKQAAVIAVQGGADVAVAITEQQQHQTLLRHSALQKVTPTTLSLTSPQVCSHQLLHPPSVVNESGGLTLPADGSLAAMTALWNAGITCFDVDVVTLQDGTLLATHPRRLAAALKTATSDLVVEESTVAERNITSIRDNVGGEILLQEPFPRLDSDLLPHYAKLVKEVSSTAFSDDAPPNLQFTTADSKPHHTQLKGPLLNLDLKQGPYLTEERLLQIVHTITELRLENSVAICVTPLTEQDKANAPHYQLDMLEILHRYNSNLQKAKDVPVEEKGVVLPMKAIPLGLVLRDRVAEDQHVDRIRQIAHDYGASIRLLVPSFKFSTSWVSRNLQHPSTIRFAHDGMDYRWTQRRGIRNQHECHCRDCEPPFGFLLQRQHQQRT